MHLDGQTTERVRLDHSDALGMGTKRARSVFLDDDLAREETT